MIEFQFRPLTSWPRKATRSRKARPFDSTYNQTLQLLDRELRHLNAQPPVIIEAAFRESDIRLDGLPRADARAPQFPGVAINFKSKHGPLRFLCDDCHQWEDNLRAIALTMERLRLADRYGVTQRGEQYAGWRALPAPIVTPPPMMSVEDAARFMAQHSGQLAARIAEDAGSFRAAYRSAALRLHPDAGYDDDKGWHRLQAAKDVLEKHHEGKGGGQ